MTKGKTTGTRTVFRARLATALSSVSRAAWRRAMAVEKKMPGSVAQVTILAAGSTRRAFGKGLMATPRWPSAVGHLAIVGGVIEFPIIVPTIVTVSNAMLASTLLGALVGVAVEAC